jgi:Domain of unknown function (DUF4082)
MTRRISFTLVSRVVLLPLALLFSGNQCRGQSLSLFTGSLPALPSVSSTESIMLGVRFWCTQPGTISAVNFYRGAKSPQGYDASLYSGSGTLLGRVTMAQESGPVPGWQQAVFAFPIPIASNTTYVAAYYAPTGEYAATPYGLSQAVSNGPLIAAAASAVGGNGVWNQYEGLPSQDYQNTNYFVDVAYVPTGRFLGIISNPPNPTIPWTAPLGSVVAQLSGVWSDGTPFTGKLSFGPPHYTAGGVYALDSNNNLIISPLGPGIGSGNGTTGTITIVATQCAPEHRIASA